MIDTITLCRNWVEQLNVQESLQCYYTNCCLPDGCFVLTTRMVEHLPHIFCSKNFTLHISEEKGKQKNKKQKHKDIASCWTWKSIHKNLLYMIAILSLGLLSPLIPSFSGIHKSKEAY
jgi:hypothetical protein